METNIRNFDGESIYVGIDSHLKSWKVTVMSDEMELRNFTQEPDTKKLSLFLHRNYPGANFKCVYEAGFAGFNAQRELTSEGISCIVIHPADVPTTDKEKRQKSDRIDSRKLVRGLKNGDFKCVHIPELLQQQDRSLLRTYDKIIRDTTRVKNRIKFFLMFFGLSIPDEFQGKNWTKEFINWLERLNPGGYANLSLQILLDEYRMLSSQTILLRKQIKELSEQARYKTNAELLKSIPGIGTLTSMILLTEIGDINRFAGLNELSAYFGLIPNCHDSGETKRVGRNTKRGNVYLKYILIEVSWMSIRYDSSLLLTYKSAVRKMDSNKAIIKVARKLLNRVRFVLKNKKPYQVNMA
jgi:Transposase and inactivated derivatives